MESPHFGEFLGQLFRSLDMSSEQVAALSGIGARTIYRWRTMAKPPRGHALAGLADALAIPLPVLRDALAGKASVPRQYTDRARWNRRAAAPSRISPSEADVVLRWYASAPLAVQRAVMGKIPPGKESQYQDRIHAYFDKRLEKLKRKASAGKK